MIFRLKVCGMTQISQIKKLGRLGVDYCGFIFYPKSPRYVLNHLSLDEISKVKGISKVGVFVNELPEKVIEIAEKAKLDYVQLHGNESLEQIQEISKKVKIIQVFSLKEKIEGLQKEINKVSFYVTYFLFDTQTEAYGGSGEKFDWKILEGLKLNRPYFLSGGIDLDAMKELQEIHPIPYALDINSKFESEPGVKDMKKVKQMCNQLKNRQ